MECGGEAGWVEVVVGGVGWGGCGRRGGLDYPCGLDGRNEQAWRVVFGDWPTHIALPLPWSWKVASTQPATGKMSLLKVEQARYTYPTV